MRKLTQSDLYDFCRSMDGKGCRECPMHTGFLCNIGLLKSRQRRKLRKWVAEREDSDHA